MQTRESIATLSIHGILLGGRAFTYSASIWSTVKGKLTCYLRYTWMDSIERSTGRQRKALRDRKPHSFIRNTAASGMGHYCIARPGVRCLDLGIEKGVLRRLPVKHLWYVEELK